MMPRLLLLMLLLLLLLAMGGMIRVRPRRLFNEPLAGRAKALIVGQASRIIRAETRGCRLMIMVMVVMVVMHRGSVGRGLTGALSKKKGGPASDWLCCAQSERSSHLP